MTGTPRRPWGTIGRGLLTLCVSVGPSGLLAQQTPSGIAEVRATLLEDNPAQLWVARGDTLWHRARGPRQASLEGCDLGLGPGVVQGAYARLPRYFDDAKRVMDLEARLIYCMQKLQGIDAEALLREPYGDGAKRSDLEALAASIAAASAGERVAPSLSRPEERAARALGERLFFYRAGTHDFSCASCHGQSGKRIRLQELPNLTEPEDARNAYADWPAYRISQGELRTLEWRMGDCIRQQRLPELRFTSDAAIALIMYLASNAQGGVMKAPGIRR
jgi:sulfur-oxidizing protein SoxA